MDRVVVDLDRARRRQPGRSRQGERARDRISRRDNRKSPICAIRFFRRNQIYRVSPSDRAQLGIQAGGIGGGKCRSYLLARAL